jgi:hypothetical protein
MNKKIMLGAVVFCLIFAMVLSTSVANALTTGTSGGTATVGAATPTITSISLKDSADSVDENGQQLIVWTEYHYACTVGDNNGLYSLLNITFVLFESTYSTLGGADHNQTHYTFEYLNSSDAYSEVGPGPSNTHLVSANCVKPTRSGTSSAIKLAFKLEKTANYTATATWKVNCTVYAEATGANNANDQSITFGVNAYYEITVVDATHGWTGLSAGDNNVLITSPAAGYITTLCTSNHYHYKLQAQSEAANLVSGGNTIPIGDVTIHHDTLGSAIPLTTTYANIVGDTALTPTDNINAAVTFKLWISVPGGTPAGSYTYTLDVQIASDT